MFTTPLTLQSAHYYSTSSKKSSSATTVATAASSKLTEWRIPVLAQPQIDNRIRHQVKTYLAEHYQKIFSPSEAEKLEEKLAYCSFYKPTTYEDNAKTFLSRLSHYETEETTSKLKEIHETFGIDILFSCDCCEQCLSVSTTSTTSLCIHQKELEERRMRSIIFQSLIEQLTKDTVNPANTIQNSLLKCRKCKSQAQFNAVQTRSADEPMTIFAKCTNPKCDAQWKW
jgi:DNA-directed RNA polymerase subunit M/transcription elongation factor TFIIS